MGFPNLGKTSVEIIDKHVPKLGLIQQVAALLPQEPLLLLPPQLSGGANKRIWVCSLIFINFYTEIDWRTSSPIFYLQPLCCSRSDAAGEVPNRGFRGLWGFSSLLVTGFFCELSHFSLVVCQGGCNNISQRKTKMCGSKVVGISLETVQTCFQVYVLSRHAVISHSKNYFKEHY